MRRDNATLWSSLFALAFGIGVLGFLTAIDRAEWFHIRPVSGTAVALSAASDQSPAGESSERPSDTIR
jgi:hypothetical protein